MPRGRSTGTASLRTTMTARPPRSGTLAALALALAAGCPQLESPVASVSGTVVGAGAGAYAYPFGRPDLKVPLAANGSFRLEGVPTSVDALVLYDGTQRAELVPVALDGGADNRLPDRFGSGAAVSDPLKMPLAGDIVAAAMPSGGAVPYGAVYAVLGTDVVDVLQGSGSTSVALGPLPAGRFYVHVHRDGFGPQDVTVDVLPGVSVPVAIPLPIDEDAPKRGCAAGMACEQGLHCNPSDGRCYPCVTSADCESGKTCIPSLGLCEDPTPSVEVCTACAGDADCASSVCVIEAGASAGYCSRLCTDAPGCPAGFACSADNRCVAPDGCADWLQTMGSTCVADSDCTDDLSGGTCQRPLDAPGYCTAWCGIDAHCRIGSGTASTMVCTSNRCALP